jgi:tripartite-type tricarboxylate transporter receptor subunit TctC
MFVAPNNAIGTTLYKNLPFVFLRDTAPVAGIMRLTHVMVVPPSLPVKTVAEFIAHAKANPGKLSYASSGNGTSVHMSAELFKMMAGLDMVHVPYRGSSAAYPDLMTGKVHVLFDNLPGSIEFVRTGQLRALGVTTAKRSDALPDIPAIGEVVPGYEASVWYGIAAPKGTPPEAIEVLNKALAALGRPEDAGAHRRTRRHADADVAGRVRQAGRRRDGEMERGGEVRRAVRGLTAERLPAPPVSSALDARHEPDRSCPARSVGHAKACIPATACMHRQLTSSGAS